MSRKIRMFIGVKLWGNEGIYSGRMKLMRRRIYGCEGSQGDRRVDKMLRNKTREGKFLV